MDEKAPNMFNSNEWFYMNEEKRHCTCFYIKTGSATPIKLEHTTELSMAYSFELIILSTVEEFVINHPIDESDDSHSDVPTNTSLIFQFKSY